MHGCDRFKLYSAESEKVSFITHNHAFVIHVFTNRYLSRCLLIEFKHPRIKSKVQEFDKLYHSMNTSSSSIGFIIGLGNELLEKGAQNLDEIIVPAIDDILGTEVFPRVSLGYGMLLWFALKVS